MHADPIERLPASGRLSSLPLLTLHLTERCNSKCVSCDYWRHGTSDIDLPTVEALLPELRALGTHTVVLSGGEPLLHPHWAQIAAALRDNGQQLWLLTSGLALAKHASRVVSLFRCVTVSLDGVDPAMYRAIRGVDAFDHVCAGVRAVAAAGRDVGLRVTVQRSNYHALSDFVRLTHQLGARQVSFLAADVGNPHAFGRREGNLPQIALSASDLDIFAHALDALERDHAIDFQSGFIAERPAKLRKILQYYAALCGLGQFSAPRCNAPEFSAVVGTRGDAAPCFFIPGPSKGQSMAPSLANGLINCLNDPAMIELRSSIRAGRRPECTTCVCSLWREPHQLTPKHFSLT